MSDVKLLDTIRTIKKSLSNKGFVFYSIDADQTDIDDIKRYYSRTELDLSDKGIKQALMSNAISAPGEF